MEAYPVHDEAWQLRREYALSHYGEKPTCIFMDAERYMSLMKEKAKRKEYPEPHPAVFGMRVYRDYDVQDYIGLRMPSHQLSTEEVTE